MITIVKIEYLNQKMVLTKVIEEMLRDPTLFAAIQEKEELMNTCRGIEEMQNNADRRDPYHASRMMRLNEVHRQLEIRRNGWPVQKMAEVDRMSNTRDELDRVISTIDKIVPLSGERK